MKKYLDDSTKTLVAKANIVKLKDFIKGQGNLIKDLTSNITTIEERERVKSTKVKLTTGC